MLDYDQAVDDFLRDIPINKGGDTSNNNNTSTAQANEDPDAEIKVRKQRKPVPKLDEARLLSDEGVPKLRRVAKRKLKFKGKGHEFSDIAGMLNLYQLWLDDLYPRAKFRDALGMVEKVGHSKRMQITRRNWMDETKARPRAMSVERVGDVEMSGALGGDTAGEHPQGEDEMNHDDAIYAETARAQAVQQDDTDMPEDDELDALMAEQSANIPQQPPTQPQRHKGPFEDDDAESDGDELDALLNGGPAKPTQPSATGSDSRDDERMDGGGSNSFADEEEVMASMGW